MPAPVLAGSGLLLAADRVRDLSGLNGAPVSMSVRGRPGKGLKRRFVVVRELKRHLIGYARVIAFRELLRIPRVPIEIRRGSVILAGLLASPFVILAFAWWVLTGKRLPRPLGAWLGDPAVVRVNMFRKLPAALLEGSTAADPTRK
jgi:hypothetical protein